MTWVVGDQVESIASGLKAKGDIHGADGMKMAWFKDPYGNILAIVSR